VELVLNKQRREVIARERSAKDTGSCQETTGEYETLSGAILEYLVKKKEYLEAGYEDMHP
jgi:hypothetical protein